MKKFLGGLAVLTLCVGAQAATVSTTITVNGSGVSNGSNITASGTVTFSGGFTGSGTLNSTFALTAAASGSVPITISVTTGSTTGTLTGTLTASATLLAQVVLGLPTASGPGTLAFTSGTGGFANSSGSFNVTAAGTGLGTTGSGAGTFSLIGPGTLTIGSGGGTTGPGAPTVAAVLNNYSFTAPGFPNSGIAPSTIFSVFGSGMADANAQAVLQDTSKGLPTTLNGASISVTVNGTTVHPALYYAIAGQIGAELPANTPTGTATMVVSYNNTPSASFTFQVVPSAPGLSTYNGLAQATNPFTGALYSYTNSAKPGDTIVLWGSGLGAITADSDTTFTSTPHTPSVPVAIYVGGIQVPQNQIYAGGSGYPGYNQFNITIPAGVTPGCNVAVVIVTGTGANQVTSNVVFIPVNAAGGVCADAIFGTNGTTAANLSGKTSINTGVVFMIHAVSPGSTAGSTQTNDIAESSFQSTTGSSYTSGGTRASLGSCSMVQSVNSGSTSTTTSKGLDAGSISVSGPQGSQALTPIGSVAPGISLAQLPTGFIPTSGGTFTFTGTGGADVGKFSTAVVFPNPLLIWTNQSADATITRSSGFDVNWTAGGGGSFVLITGTSSNSSGASASFYCYAPLSAGTFHVPGYITLGMPAGSGTASVENEAAFTSFAASLLDFGYAGGITSTQINAVYQ